MANSSALINQQRALLLQQSQTSSTPSLVGAGLSGAEGESPFKDPRKLAHKHKVASRFYPREITGSPALFASNPAKARTLIATEHSIRYRPHGSPIGSARFGDPQRAYILQAKVVNADNEFPFGIMWQSNGIRGRFYGPEDQRAFFFSPARSHLSYPEGFDVLRPSQQFTSNVLKNFGHCTKESFKAGVIGKIKGDYIIEHDPTSAIFQILLENQVNRETGKPNYDMQEFRYLTDPTTGKLQYKIPKGLYKSAKDCFNKKVIPRMPHTDFASMTVGIERLGKAWSAPFDVYHPSTMESADDIIANQSGTATIVLWFKYRLIFSGNDD